MSLTDEDKAWLSKSFEQVNSKFEQVNLKFDQLSARISNLDSKVDQNHLAALAEIERVETSLLTAFHRWASPLDARMRTHNSAIHTIDLEIEAIKDRLTKLERPAN